MGRLPCLVVLLLLSAAAAATCGKDPVQPSQPSPSCASIAESSRSIVLGPDAITFTVAVNAPAGCSWTTTVSGTFLTLSGGTSAQPRGTFEVSASENSGAERTGTITVGTSTASVRQAAAIPCIFNVAPITLPQFPTAGGDAAIDVSVLQGKNCAWTATSSHSFVTIASGASGVGNGSVRVTVTPNDSAVRVGQLTVAGQSVTVDQNGPCRFLTNHTTFNVPATASQRLTTVWPSVGPWDCPRTAASNSAFIQARILGCSDSGCQVEFTIDANFGAARTGTATVGGVTVTFNQDGR
jgi:hypothetical protein